MRMIGKIRDARIIAPVLWLTLAVLASAGQEWHYETVDNSGVGKFSSLRIDRDGNAHVAYLDPVQLLLKYGFWDHSLHKWFTVTVDKSAGFCSLAVDSKRRPHISYLEYGTSKLKYAHWDGSAWQKEALQINAKVI